MTQTHSSAPPPVSSSRPPEPRPPSTPPEPKIGLYLEHAGQVSLHALSSDQGAHALAALLVGDPERRRTVELAMTTWWRRTVIVARVCDDRARFDASFRALLPHASDEHLQDVWVALRPDF